MTPLLALLLTLDATPTLGPAPADARLAPGPSSWASLLLRSVPTAAPSPAALELGQTRHRARLPDSPEAAQPWHWKKKAGITCTLAGLALVAGGGVTTALTQGPASKLDARFRSRSLTLDDRSAYEEVGALNVVAIGLYVLGAATSATGVTLWALSPSAKVGPSGASLNLSGSF